MEEYLSQNDNEFIEGRIEEINNQLPNNHNIIENAHIYNSQDFLVENIINFLQSNNILKKFNICSKCGKLMKLENNQTYLDGKIWRCRSNTPYHDLKINIRTDSIYEGSQISLPVLYFVTFYCFPENYSLQKTYIEVNSYKNLLGNNAISKIAISKIYNKIRMKISETFQKNWNTKFLGMEIGMNSYDSVEIDESEIIGNENEIYWMFGLIDRITKEARIFSILNDRTKSNLLKYVKNNVYTNNEDDINNDEYSENELLNTRIYSDCFASYQPSDFQNLGYLLKRVNHSIWFGYGLFHTNNVEGLWSQIKRLTKNFSGISISNINQMFDNNKDKNDYLNGWISFGLFLREIEKRKLSRLNRIKLLCEYIKI